MPETKNDRVRHILNEKHRYYQSWFDVGDELGINRGLLCAVANGRKRGSRAVIRAVQFELNAMEYEAWREAHRAELEAIVTWASVE